MPNQKIDELVQFPELSKEDAGIYVFSTGIHATCPKQFYKVGMSTAIKQRFFSYHLSYPHGVLPTVVMVVNYPKRIKGDRSEETKYLLSIESALFRHLEQNGVPRAQTTTRTNKPEWFVSNHVKMVKECRAFFKANRKLFGGKMKDQQTGKMVEPILVFSNPKSNKDLHYSCKDVK